MAMNETNINFAAGSLGRILPIGLLPGADLVNGFKEVCYKNSLRYGVVLTVVGSLYKLTFSQIISDSDERKKEFGLSFTEPRVVPGPLQVLSVQGIIYESESGDIVVYLHGTFNDVNGQIHGGHLLDGENPVRNRLEAVIAEIKDIKLIEKYNKQIGTHVFSPEQL